MSRYESGLKVESFTNEKKYNALVKASNFSSDHKLPSIDELKLALQDVYDPEIPVDIYNLGLIYDIDINSDHNVAVLMTLTSPACPVAEELPYQAADAIASVKGVQFVGVEITWDVPWNSDMLTDEAKLELNML